MGDNANASWAWHNTVVGKGYQAKGVVRQRGTCQSPSAEKEYKIVDMSAPAEQSDGDEPTRKKAKSDNRERERDGKKSKKSKKDKKERKNHKDKKDKKSKHKKESKKGTRDDCDSESSRGEKYAKTISFNPILQLLASRLIDQTR
jgi:hypothetical protein